MAIYCVFKAILQISLYICSPNLNHLVNDHLRLDRTSRTAALNKEGKFNFMMLVYRSFHCSKGLNICIY